jgi:hypothetical protein
MERAVARTKKKKSVVGEAKKWSPEYGENRELVVGPFDRRKSVAHRVDLFPLVKAASPDEHMRDVPRL